MNESPDRLFGLTIAYVLPGFVGLWGTSSLWPELSNLLAVLPQANPSIATFLFAVLASLAAGLTLSAVRWALIDFFHHRTGVPFPNPDFSKVQERLEAFKFAVEVYYRYYQFYANMFVAIGIAAVCRMAAGMRPNLTLIALGIGLEVVLLVASRDALSRYYTRVAQLLGTRPMR
jgi:hypothetical protein